MVDEEVAQRKSVSGDSSPRRSLSGFSTDMTDSSIALVAQFDRINVPEEAG
jgi:hypothetical protein